MTSLGQPEHRELSEPAILRKPEKILKQGKRHGPTG